MNTYNTLLNIIIISNIILLILVIITLIIRLYMLSKPVVRNLYVFVHRCIRKIAMCKYKANYSHVTGHASKVVGIAYTKIDCDKHSHLILYA